MYRDYRAKHNIDKKQKWPKNEKITEIKKFQTLHYLQTGFSIALFNWQAFFQTRRVMVQRVWIYLTLDSNLLTQVQHK